MFEIHASDIAELNDSDLRTLVSLLCEAELRQQGFSPAAVTAGGDQDAPDGGVDVRVDLPRTSRISGYVPRPATCFQVKVPDMPPAEIRKEMRPKDRLRPSIAELISASGAYIIVSSHGSVADTSLHGRREAMRNAVADTSGADSLVLDFYDQERIASWVRCHKGLVAWIRERIGRPIRGWQPYGSWAATEEGLDAEYLMDDKTRLLDGRNPQSGPVAVVEGIRRIRDVLAKPKGVARLVGLSGTGKTRLAQALFDDRVGGSALGRTLAVYTDLGNEPDPSPRDLVTYLIQDGQREVVVVDNCPPATHRALADACSTPDSKLSLLTIEYDVGDDEPENTETFRLESASSEVVEWLLERRTPHVSQVDRRHIAELSGGNARIALALAHTVRRGETITRLSDRDLFDRLFHQRQQHETGLLRSAEALALVYSFNGEEVEGKAAELPVLAEVAGQTVDDLYRNVVELRRRELVQRRSQWRAVLPHALANRLARQALEAQPPQRIAGILGEEAPHRLRQSFSRRLGYLHDCEIAQGIVREWMADGGLLGNLSTIDELGMAMFQNVAPVLPEFALIAIEREASRADPKNFFGVSNYRRRKWISLLRSLAYDPALFVRAALLLANFAAEEPPDYKTDPASHVFRSLFHIYLSGTHATIEQRLQIVATLIAHRDEAHRQCGLGALDALMNASHFSSSYNFSFGARPRDFGWQPKSVEDFSAWFDATVAFAAKLGCSGRPHAQEAKKLLARRFRELYVRTPAANQLKEVAQTLITHGSWHEGWRAVRNTIHLDHEKMPVERLADLRELERLLSPTTLREQVHAYVLPKRWGSLDIGDGEPVDDPNDVMASHNRVEHIAEDLGQEVAANPEILSEFLPHLVRGHLGLGFSFGRGLAAGTNDLEDTWSQLVSALSEVPDHDRNISVITGLLSGASETDKEVTGRLLEGAMSHPVLGPSYPSLETYVEIGEYGARRLLASLDLGIAPTETYHALIYGRVTETIPSELLREIVQTIANRPDGFVVAVHILGMRLLSKSKEGGSADRDLILCGRELLCNAPLNLAGGMTDHHMDGIVSTCFHGLEAAEAATILCRRVKTALADSGFFPSDCKDLLTSLFREQPLAALDEFVGERAQTDANDLMPLFPYDGKYPIDEVPVGTLVHWAEADPTIRYPRLASILRPLEKGGEGETVRWSETALRLIELAPDKVEMLNQFSVHFRPNGWSGSLAQILESRRALPQAFFDHPDATVADRARELDDWLLRAAEEERAREQRYARRTDESFE